MKTVPERAKTPPETVCRTVRQYSRGQIPQEDMDKLAEIAEDYRQVKNYVYDRYGGIGSLSKIYPGYTVQNEMTESGMRARLGLPSVYFYLAVFDALGDIKCRWTETKARVSKLAGRNDQFTPEEKHYIRFLLKVNNAFDAVLNGKEADLPKGIRKQYEELSEKVDTGRLNRYLCRQVRRCHTKLHTEIADGFSTAERAYRYAYVEEGIPVEKGSRKQLPCDRGQSSDDQGHLPGGKEQLSAFGEERGQGRMIFSEENIRKKQPSVTNGIYLATKENRRRIFVPLTDSCQYTAQLYIKLNVQERRVEIHVPVRTAVRVHEDYTAQTGIALGIFTMLTTDQGHTYGERLGQYQTEYADWVREQTRSWHRNREDNPGRKKYYAKKRRYEEQLHSYINCELNRFLREERPGTVYMAKLPKPQGGGINKKINHSAAMWQRGYIRRRLEQKCREQSVRLVEVLGKDISRECSRCGEVGSSLGEPEGSRSESGGNNSEFNGSGSRSGSDDKRSRFDGSNSRCSGRKKGIFICGACGYSVEEKTNTARNARKRGEAGEK